MHLILEGKEVENQEALKLIFFFMFTSQKIEKLSFLECCEKIIAYNISQNRLCL